MRLASEDVLAKLPDAAASSTCGRLRSKLISLADLLIDRRWHSTADLLGAGGTGYSARLQELRAAGWKIESNWVKRGAWRYRATRIGGGEPQRYVLGKQALRVLIRTLDAVDQAAGDEALTAVFERLPDGWQKELASDDAWVQASAYEELAGCLGGAA